MNFRVNIINKGNSSIYDNEHWKTINDYPCYEVSDLGRVRNKHSNKILKGKVSNKGYLRVSLYNNKTKHRSYGIDIPVHRLVLETFNPVDDYTLTIDHINNNKLDNRLINLQYLTIQDNIRKANSIKVGLFDNITGELIKVYNSCREASKDAKKSRNYVSSRISNNTIINNKYYKFI